MCFVGNKADNEIQRQVSFAEACNWCKVKEILSITKLQLKKMWD